MKILDTVGAHLPIRPVGCPPEQIHTGSRLSKRGHSFCMPCGVGTNTERKLSYRRVEFNEENRFAGGPNHEAQNEKPVRRCQRHLESSRVLSVLTMMPILLHKLSASSMECVVKITLHSLSVVVIRLMMSHMNRLAIGSIPALKRGHQSASVTTTKQAKLAVYIM